MVSLHGKIANELRQLVTSGAVQPGEYLPTEAQLAERYNVSRNTIKTATAALMNAGLVERVAGRHGGIRVREKVVLTHFASRAELPDSPYSETDTFMREVEEQGFVPSQTFALELVELTAENAQWLEVEEATHAALRRCVRYVNDKPTSIQATYYPKWLTDQVPELLSPRDISIGTTKLLAQKGFEQIALIDVSAARMPTPEEALTLELRTGTPILEYLRVGYTATRPVRVGVHVMAGDSNRIIHAMGDPKALRRALDQDE